VGGLASGKKLLAKNLAVSFLEGSRGKDRPLERGKKAPEGLYHLKEENGFDSGEICVWRSEKVSPWKEGKYQKQKDSEARGIRQIQPSHSRKIDSTGGGKSKIREKAINLSR